MAEHTSTDGQVSDGRQNGRALRVGLTGADRFLGRHVLLTLETAGCDVRVADDETLSSPHKLARFVRDCQTLVHLAGNDFLAPEESARQQIRRAWSLVWACEAVRACPNVITTAQAARTEQTRLIAAAANEAGSVLMDWARRNEVVGTTLQIPEVYGPGVDATTHSIVNELCRGVQLDRVAANEAMNELELLWVGDLADEIVDYILFPSEETGPVRVHGELEANSRELADELAILKASVLDRCSLPDNSDEARRTLGITLAACAGAPVAGRSNTPGAGQLAGLPVHTVTEERFHTRTLHRVFVDHGRVRLRYRSLNATDATDVVLSHDGLNTCLLPPFIAYSLIAESTEGAKMIVSAVRGDLDQGNDLHSTTPLEEQSIATGLGSGPVKQAA